MRAHAARGDNVVFTYWSSADEAKALAGEFGDRVLALHADVTDEAQVDQVVRAGPGALRPIDTLVANAGGLLKRVKCVDMTLEFWNQAIALNLTSAFLCCRAALRHMLPRRSGNIVIMSSLAGHDGGGPGASHYGAAKGALLTYTRALAKEVGPEGVRVNAIAPGLIATRFHDVFNTPQGPRRRRRAHAVAPRGAARRRCQCDAVPELRGVVVHHRRSDRGQRRHGHVLNSGSSLAGLSPLAG